MPLDSKAQLALGALQKRHDSINQKLLRHTAAKRFFIRSGLIAQQLRQKSTRILAGAGLTGALLLTPVSANLAAINVGQVASPQSRSLADALRSNLQAITPHTPTRLEPQQAAPIEEAIYTTTGLRVRAVLEGQQLNHQVGYVGYEQHLRRYPGDNLIEHDDEQIAGIAPGLGAWGYFAKSRASFTTQDYLREKYYCVAQTLYLPNWNQDFVRLRDWYKYRKVLIVNPASGSAVVCDIGDAGPSKWTGKQFGASPEAMAALNLSKGPRKGLVLFLFLDDPDNQVALGPLTQPINLPPGINK